MRDAGCGMQVLVLVLVLVFYMADRSVGVGVAAFNATRREIRACGGVFEGWSVLAWRRLRVARLSVLVCR